MKNSLKLMICLLASLIFLSSCSNQPTNPPPLTSLPAAPVIAKINDHYQFHGIPVLMFHYIRLVDKQKDLLGYNLSLEPTSFSKLLLALKKKGYHTIHIADLLSGQALPTNPIILSFDDGYEDFYNTAWPLLKKNNFTASTAIITSFMQNDSSAQTYMNSAQIKTLDQNNIEILSHTVTHADLSKDPHQQSEIEYSKATLEKLLGHTVDVLVYPSGKYNDETIKLAFQAGYKMAFTTHQGLADSNLGDYEQPRIRIDNRSDLNQVIAKL